MLNLKNDRHKSVFVGIGSLERALFFCIIIIIALFVGYVNLSQASPNLVLVYFSFLAYLIALSFPFIIYKHDWGWFHPLIFFVLWFELVRNVIPRLGTYSSGLEIHYALSGMSSGMLNIIVSETLLLHTLSLTALYTGFFFFGRLKTPIIRFKQSKNILIKVLSIATLSFTAFMVLVNEAGGLGSLLLQRGLSEGQRIDASGIWYVLVSLIKTTCIVWLALMPEVWKKWSFIIVFGFSLFIGFAATGSRAGIIVYLIMVMAIWCIHNRRIPYTRGLILGMISLIIIGIGGQFRAASRSTSNIEEINIDTSIYEIINEGLSTITEYSGVIDGGYAILGNVPENEDLLYGKSYLSMPVAPIPRAIWPSKPEAGGRLVAKKLFSGRDGGVPPGNIGEAYWNFHIPGVFVVFFIWGLFLKWLASFFRNNVASSSILAIYVLTLFFLQPNTPAFYAWIRNIVFAVIILIFFCGVPRLRR